MEGTHAVGRQPFMPDSTLSRRSAALHARLAKYPSGNHKIIPRIQNLRNTQLLDFNTWTTAGARGPVGEVERRPLPAATRTLFPRPLVTTGGETCDAGLEFRSPSLCNKVSSSACSCSIRS